MPTPGLAGSNPLGVICNAYVRDWETPHVG